MIFLHLTTGRGPSECEMGLDLLISEIQKEAIIARLVCSAETEKSTYGSTSALISISGDDEVSFAESWIGTIEWICKSTIRPNHKRKRWYLGICIFDPKNSSIEINDNDLIWETIKASGPGGQHVNKTDSAVRLTHVPSGIVVKSQEERSQHRNKSVAKAKLIRKLEFRQERVLANDTKNRWSDHNTLERGNSSRTYEGLEFCRKY